MTSLLRAYRKRSRREKPAVLVVSEDGDRGTTTDWKNNEWRDSKSSHSRFVVAPTVTARYSTHSFTCSLLSMIICGLPLYGEILPEISTHLPRKSPNVYLNDTP